MGDVIPFPTREPPEVVEDEVVEDEDVEYRDPLAGCEGCGTITDEHHEECVIDVDPDEIIEANGRWVWVPVDREPVVDPSVGMVAHKIATMCRWEHRHIMDGETMPQPCCYSVHITTRRLPGPVRQPRNWLAPDGEDEGA